MGITVGKRFLNSMAGRQGDESIRQRERGRGTVKGSKKKQKSLADEKRQGSSCGMGAWEQFTNKNEERREAGSRRKEINRGTLREKPGRVVMAYAGNE